MSFKDFCSYFSLVAFCSVEQNNFNDFGRESPMEHFFEIILKSNHWPRRRYRLKFFYFYF